MIYQAARSGRRRCEDHVYILRGDTADRVTKSEEHTAWKTELVISIKSGVQDIEQINILSMILRRRIAPGFHQDWIKQI